jgi:hypothetical protein
VPLPYFRHSTHFLDPVHAKRFWLPFLWGYSPEEFRHYLVLCRSAAYLRQEQRWGELADVEATLHRSIWTWTKGKTLNAYVADEVKHYLNNPKRAVGVRRPERNVDYLVEEVVQLIYIAAVDGSKEVDKENGRDEDVTRAYHPPTAIARAVGVVLDVAA